MPESEPWLLTLLLWEKDIEGTEHLYPIHRDVVDEAKFYCDFLTRCFFRPCEERTWNS